MGTNVTLPTKFLGLGLRQSAILLTSFPMWIGVLVFILLAQDPENILFLCVITLWGLILTATTLFSWYAIVCTVPAILHSIYLIQIFESIVCTAMSILFIFQVITVKEILMDGTVNTSSVDKFEFLPFQIWKHIGPGSLTRNTPDTIPTGILGGCFVLFLTSLSFFGIWTVNAYASHMEQITSVIELQLEQRRQRMINQRRKNKGRNNNNHLNGDNMSNTSMQSSTYTQSFYQQQQQSYNYKMPQAKTQNNNNFTVANKTSLLPLNINSSGNSSMVHGKPGTLNQQMLFMKLEQQRQQNSNGIASSQQWYPLNPSSMRSSANVPLASTVRRNGEEYADSEDERGQMEKSGGRRQSISTSNGSKGSLTKNNIDVSLHPAMKPPHMGIVDVGAIAVNADEYASSNM